MNDAATYDVREINETYVNDFNRIAKSVDVRCELTGEHPSPGEMETQIALRASIMKIASLRRELTSIRAVVTYFLEEEIWPEGIEERDWIMSADMEIVGQLHSGLVRTAKEFVTLGHDVSEDLVERAMQMNFPGSEEDAARALSGMSPERSRRKARDKKYMQPITDRDFMELELQLSDHPHQNALKTLRMKRTDSKALLRIFMRSIRLTGMRPIEVFTCRILVGDENTEYSPEMIDEIKKAPYRMALKGILMPIDALDPQPWGSMAAMVRNATNITGVPPILMIEAAKTTNANPDLLRPFRAQVLTGIEDDDLEVLCLAAHLHHFKMDKKRYSNLITTMTRNLTASAELALPQRKDTLNLYSFRHDFATRARRLLQVWEVAALMGHTARASTYAYGKRNTRKKSGSGSGGWMPIHDCEFAEAIREKWGASPEGAPVVDARQELATALGLDLPDHTPFPKLD
jgi:integrase